MSDPTLLLFDLGGVLLENTTFISLKRLLTIPLDEASLRDRWLTSEAVRQFERGSTSTGDFADAFIAEWQLDLTPDQFLETFRDWPTGYYAGAQDALRALRKRYRIACLSNSNGVHWEKFHGFAEEFDIAISSHQLGAVKPDRTAFVRALELCDVAPAEICFFDDALVNVRAAQDLGICAFQVEGFPQLRRLLATEGFLP